MAHGRQLFARRPQLFPERDDAQMIAPSRTTRAFQFSLLVIAAVAATYARFTLSPLQDAMAASLGLNDNAIGLLQGPVLAVPAVLLSVPIGMLVDRWSRARLLLLFAFMDLIGGILTAEPSHFAVLVAGRALVGIAVPATSVAAFSLLADLQPPEMRGRASMILVIGQYAGLSAAMALGGFFLRLTGPDNWARAMVLANLPLVPVILLLFALREPRRSARLVDTRNSLDSRLAFAALWTYRRPLSVMITGLVMADFAVFAVLTWAASAFTRHYGLSAAVVGSMLGISVLISGLAGPALGGFVADICQRSGGPRRTITAMGVLAMASAPAGLFALIPNSALACVVLTLYSIIGGAILVAGLPVFTIVIPNELRGLSLSVSGAIQNICGIGLVPLAISLLSNNLGGKSQLSLALAIICTGASIVGSLVFLCGRLIFDSSTERPLLTLVEP